MLGIKRNLERIPLQQNARITHLASMVYLIRDHSFTTFANFSGKLTFTPWYELTCVYQGVRNVSFSENFANVINELSLSCEKQVFCKKRCSRKFHKIHRKTESLTQVFSCEFCKISKNTFLQNTSGRLLLSCPTAGSQSQAAYNRFPKKADFLKLGKTHIILESSF